MAPCRVARRVRRPVGMRDCGPWPPAGSLRLRASLCSSPLRGAARRAARRCERELARRPRAAGAAPAAPTEPANGQALCPRCNLDQGRAAGVIAPRGPGRPTFLARHAAARRRGTSCWWRPRAPGKTLAACQAIRAADCEQVVVVCPTTALRAQWADAADRVGLHLDPRWRNADGAWRADVDGVVVTYQQVASAPDLFAHHLARPTFVVLDEIHHAGESATWGTALRAAFDGARQRLALSGTPFRSDARAIPFVRYDDERRCAPDFVYGYGEAVADEVCRPLAFRLLDATLRWRVDAQETIAALRRRARPRPTTRGGCAPRSTRARRCCRRCCATPTRCSLKARAVIPDAAGLVLCDDRAHARATRDAAAHDRRREAGRGGQRRAAGAHADRALRAAATPARRAGWSR